MCHLLGLYNTNYTAMKCGKASMRDFNEYNRKKYFPGVCSYVHFTSPLIIETVFE